jgi:hypothetical protein
MPCSGRKGEGPGSPVTSPTLAVRSPAAFEAVTFPVINQNGLRSTGMCGCGGKNTSEACKHL